jgi:hypothetical protein
VSPSALMTEEQPKSEKNVRIYGEGGLGPSHSVTLQKTVIIKKTAHFKATYASIYTPCPYRNNINTQGTV